MPNARKIVNTYRANAQRNDSLLKHHLDKYDDTFGEPSEPKANSARTGFREVLEHRLAKARGL